jgi:hypothetical protein
MFATLQTFAMQLQWALSALQWALQWPFYRLKNRYALQRALQCIATGIAMQTMPKFPKTFQE